MAQWLGILAENLSTIQAPTLGSPQLLIMLAPGNLISSSGLREHLDIRMHKPAHKHMHSHVIYNKQF